MPDWTYHPLLRPIGIALHGDRTRSVTMRRLGRISRTAAGRGLVRTFGDLRAPADLAFRRDGLELPSPVLLSGSVDPEKAAGRAFEQLEFGGVLEQHVPGGPSAALVVAHRGDAGQALAGGARLVLVQTEAGDEVPPGCGVLVAGDFDEVLVRVRRIRAENPEVLLAAGGDDLHTPAQAVRLREAGADLLVVGEGLALAGPGLAKRVNRALLADRRFPREFPRTAVSGALFALGLLFAACVGMYVALTSVILPFDEEFLGLDLAGLAGVNERLPDFMAHDRLSYSGATAGAAVFYLGLAVFGLRRRRPWAVRTFLATGLTGFATFLLYFGFGYLDRANALVVAILLPFFLLAVVRPEPTLVGGPFRDVVEDAVRRRALWGQLLLVVLGIGLLVGGLVICVVGVTRVFVISDLDFLATSAHLLHAAHDGLLPLIAHDRASFGGALLTDGLAVTLIAAWGLERGEPWTWWTIAVAGAVTLASTLYAHFSTGYTELGHLMPVFGATVLFGVGLALTWSFLHDRRTSGVDW